MRKPNRWNYIGWAPGILGWIEMLICMTPLANLLYYWFVGFWNCKVCGRPRKQHLARTIREASVQLWRNAAIRRVDHCVRWVKGGVSCPPGESNWCLVCFLIANYCKDAFASVKNIDQTMAHWHQTNPTPVHRTYFTEVRSWL
mmetsp:Transcript_23967/g.37556  ORF Transcript_23967/g.37556 Transcript_23967/m.37556 type:complete len:143 (+) Transcript_23967:329-757(+)